jgi:hypothetical protein
MSYRIAEVGPNRCTVQLTSSAGNARFFKTAQWNFHVEPAAEGTLLTCSADFSLRSRYFFLGPLLYAMKGAIHADLERLRRVLEETV